MKRVNKLGQRINGYGQLLKEKAVYLRGVGVTALYTCETETDHAGTGLVIEVEQVLVGDHDITALLSEPILAEVEEKVCEAEHADRSDITHGYVECSRHEWETA